MINLNWIQHDLKKRSWSFLRLVCINNMFVEELTLKFIICISLQYVQDKLLFIAKRKQKGFHLVSNMVHFPIAKFNVKIN